MCAWCNCRLDNHKWKAPNYQVTVSEYILQTRHNARIPENAYFCKSCYHQQTEFQPSSSPSTDYQLRGIIEQYSEEAQCTGVPIRVVVAAANELLTSGAVLLATVYDEYQAALVQEDSPKPAVYVLNQLRIALGHHLTVVQPKSRRDSTMLLRHGCSTKQALHVTLCAQRTRERQTEQDFTLEEGQPSLVQAYSLQDTTGAQHDIARDAEQTP